MSGRMGGFVSKNRAAMLGTSAAVAIAFASYSVDWHEGTKFKAYRDPVGIWTYCTGETKNVEIGKTYTKAECDELRTHELWRNNAALEKCVKRNPITVGIRFAWLDTIYNIGAGGFCKSSMARLYNAGQDRAACEALRSYVYARGEWLKGLFERREDMVEACFAGIPN